MFHFIWISNRVLKYQNTYCSDSNRFSTLIYLVKVVYILYIMMALLGFPLNYEIKIFVERAPFIGPRNILSQNLMFINAHDVQSLMKNKIVYKTMFISWEYHKNELFCCPKNIKNKIFVGDGAPTVQCTTTTIRYIVASTVKPR